MSIFFRETFQRSFGTYPLHGEVLTASMIAAAEIGYRAFDTAQMYGNEKDVGAALAELDLPRAELCIATKMHPDKFSPDRFIDSVTTSLRDLGLDYVDVLFVHWPPVGGDIRPSLELLEDAHRKGYAKHIAVSNYTAATTRTPGGSFPCLSPPTRSSSIRCWTSADCFTRRPRPAFRCRPTPPWRAARCSTIRCSTKPALAYGRTAGQIVLRWILQTGVAVNTMSTKPQNIRANFDVMDFTLSSVEYGRDRRTGRNQLPRRDA